MKPIYLLIFIVLTSCSISSKKSSEKSILEKEKLFVGELINDSIAIRIDKANFIKEINHSMFKDENIIDELTIKTNYTLGDKKVKYYHLNLSSSKKKLNIIRWLFNRDGKLYIDKSPEEGFTYADFYMTCEGIEGCKPRLYIYDSEYSWGCRDFLGCVTEEEAESNRCSQSATVF